MFDSLTFMDELQKKKISMKVLDIRNDYQIKKSLFHSYALLMKQGLVTNTIHSFDSVFEAIPESIYYERGLTLTSEMLRSIINKQVNLVDKQVLLNSLSDSDVFEIEKLFSLTPFTDSELTKWNDSTSIFPDGITVEGIVFIFQILGLSSSVSTARMALSSVSESKGNRRTRFSRKGINCVVHSKSDKTKFSKGAIKILSETEVSVKRLGFLSEDLFFDHLKSKTKIKARNDFFRSYLNSREDFHSVSDGYFTLGSLQDIKFTTDLIGYLSVIPSIEAVYLNEFIKRFLKNNKYLKLLINFKGVQKKVDIPPTIISLFVNKLVKHDVLNRFSFDTTNHSFELSSSKFSDASSVSTKEMTFFNLLLKNSSVSLSQLNKFELDLYGKRYYSLLSSSNEFFTKTDSGFCVSKEQEIYADNRSGNYLQPFESGISELIFKAHKNIENLTSQSKGLYELYFSAFTNKYSVQDKTKLYYDDEYLSDLEQLCSVAYWSEMDIYIQRDIRVCGKLKTSDDHIAHRLAVNERMLQVLYSNKFNKAILFNQRRIKRLEKLRSKSILPNFKFELFLNATIRELSIDGECVLFEDLKKAVEARLLMDSKVIRSFYSKFYTYHHYACCTML